MKRLSPLLVGSMLLLLTACLKKDVRFSHGPPYECSVVRYSAIGFSGLSYGNGMEKTFNENGWVKTLRMELGANFQFVDSVFYSISYKFTSPGAPVLASILTLKKHFEYDNGQLTPSTSAGDEHYTLSASFDPHKGYLTSISGNGGFFPGSFVLKYTPSGQLVKFGNMVLVYDAKGNIIRVPAKDGSAHGAMIYHYNLNKTGKSQFYLTSGYNVHEYYNLAEACQWIPVQPNNVRTSQDISWGQFDDGTDYIAGGHLFTDHVFDSKGYLISYKTGYPLQPLNNTWTCKSWDVIK